MTFGLKARILQILIKIGATAHNNRMERLSEVYRIASESLNISQEQFVSTLLEMARERLVFSYAEQEIFVVNSYDSVSASWRGEYLLQNLGRYSPLALAYLEDLEIVSGDEGEIVAEVGRPLRAQSSDAVISMIHYAFKIELAQIEALEGIGIIDKFLTVFPRTPISDELFKALRRDTRDVEEDLAVDFSETRAFLNAKMKKRGGIANRMRPV